MVNYGVRINDEENLRLATKDAINAYDGYIRL